MACMTECDHLLEDASFMTTKNLYVISMKIKCMDCGESYEWVNLSPMGNTPDE